MAATSPLSEQKPDEYNNPADSNYEKKLGQNDSSEPNQQYLKQREGLDNPDSSDNAPAGSDDSESSDEDLGPEASLYRKASPNPASGARRGFSISRRWRRKRVAVAAVLVGGAAAAGIAIFLALLPLKILHIVNNLQSHFYESSTNAVQSETDSLVSHYVKKYVLCPNFVTQGNVGCKIFCTSNPVSCLYQSWRNNKFEDQLEKKYGLKFGYNQSTRHYYMKAPGLPKDGISIDEFVNNKNETLDQFLDKTPQLQKATRSEIRLAVKTATQNETRWDKTMIRFKAARLLEEKYGIPRCILFCGTKDKLADAKKQQKNAAKIVVSRLVFAPRNQELDIAIQCLLDVNCHPEQTTSAPCQEGVDCELASAPESETDINARTKLESLAAQYGVEDTESLVALYTELEEKGLSQYMIEKVFAYLLGDAAGEAAAQNISDVIPLIGWVNLASQIVGTADHAGPKLKKLDYLVNSASAVSLFATYRVYADEIKTGKVNSTEVGSLVDSLGPGNHSDNPNDKEVGGTAGAEQTPLYSYLVDKGSITGSSNYKCSDGNPPAGGSIDKAACQEEKPGQGNDIANYIHNVLNLPGLNLITAIANIWNGTIGSILNFLGSFISWVTSPVIGLADKACNAPVILQGPFQAYCASKDLIKKGAAQIANAVTNFLIPNPFGSNMSGGRTFDMVAAGADVSGNDYAHNGIGGQTLTNQQVATIMNRQEQQQKAQYDHQSLVARMFDTSSSYSMVNKMAMAMPTSSADLRTSVASLFTNPFKHFSNIFGSVFSHASAATAAADPFGVTQYGYPADDPIFQTDPQAYWDQNCADDPSNAYQKNGDNSWNQAASQTLDPVTGMPTNTTTNPCLLIKSAVGSDGAVFDSSLLTQDDLADSSTSSTSLGSTSGGTGSLPTGSSQQLAQQLLPFIAQGKIFCGPSAGGSGPANCADIQNTAKGQPLGGNCRVSALTPHLLGLILGLVRDDKWTLGISAICSDHHLEGDGPYGGHSNGSVADFSVENRSSGLAAATNEQFVDDVAALLASSGGSFGQVATSGGVNISNGGCHLPYSSQKAHGFTLFEDSCTHQHVRAAP
jgi:hypothetical protein